MDYESKIKKTSKDIDSIKTIHSKSKFWIPFTLMIPAIIFFAIFTIIPLLMVLGDSVSAQYKNPYYLTQYGVVWSDPVWYQSIMDSFIYSIISVPLALIVALLVSFSISNIITKKFRGFWQTIFFIPYITSTVAVSIAFSNIFQSNQYGIINSILGTHIGWLDNTYDNSKVAFIPILAFGVWHSIAFKVLILTSAMLAIDKRLYDAASIDGITKKDMFFNITLPELNSTIWYLVTIGIIGGLKVFPMALFGNDPNAALDGFPTLLMYVYSAVQNANYGLAGAASISLVLVIILFNYVIRKFMHGIENYFGNKSERKMAADIKRHEHINGQSVVYDETISEWAIDDIVKGDDKDAK